MLFLIIDFIKLLAIVLSNDLYNKIFIFCKLNIEIFSFSFFINNSKYI